MARSLAQVPVDDRTPAFDTAPVGLKQQAYAELKRLILLGELPAGVILSVRQLATRLNMSRTPVHAAVERLEADGLVTLAPQQGFIVREMSVRDIVNHYEIRQALEPFVVRRLAGCLNEEQLQQLRENQKMHLDAVRQHRVIDLIRVDVDFHQLLCRFLGNDEITQVMRQLCDKVQYVIRCAAEQFPQRIMETYDEHRAIVEAVVSGEGDRAAGLAHEHLENGLRRFWSH